MNEKFEFFKSLYESSLVESEKIKKDFLDFAKFTPLLLALSYFFYQAKETPITFIGSGIEWYNLVLVIHLLIFLVFVFFTWFGFLLYPRSSILNSPTELAKHWDDLASENLELSESKKFQDSMMPMYIEAAGHNDGNNVYRSRLKRLTGIAMLGVLGSYIILAIIYGIRTNG